MNNLELYEKGRAVPAEAKKAIGAGRLKGMTDINPMWRIKKLTEMFGAVGDGWKAEIVNKEIIPVPDTKEAAAFVDIKLYYKLSSGEWSAAIPGTGGAMFVASEKSGLHVNDEAFKMAYTDAISVAAKALGIGADVYWDKDKTKYSSQTAPPKAPEKKQEPPKKDPETPLEYARETLRKKVIAIRRKANLSQDEVINKLLAACAIEKPETVEDYEGMIAFADMWFSTDE